MTDENGAIVDPERLGARLGAQDEQEAREFEEVAAQLALSAEPVQPPPALKVALLAQLDATPQLPRQVLQEADPETAVEAAPPRQPQPAAAAERARRRWFQRPTAILAAAAAAAIVFIAGAFVGIGITGTDSYQNQQAAGLAAINAAADVQRSSAEIAGGGTATLVWSAQLGKSALIATDLPKLADDKTYELWYIRDGSAIPAGTMDSTGAAATWRVLSGELTSGATIGMTVEPYGGSQKPTTQPIVAITA